MSQSSRAAGLSSTTFTAFLDPTSSLSSSAAWTVWVTALGHPFSLRNNSTNRPCSPRLRLQLLRWNLWWYSSTTWYLSTRSSMTYETKQAWSRIIARLKGWVLSRPLKSSLVILLAVPNRCSTFFKGKTRRSSLPLRLLFKAMWHGTFATNGTEWTRFMSVPVTIRLE